MSKTHFGRRCAERCITSVDGDALGVAIYKHAIGEVTADNIERVGVYGGAVFYRFIVDEGQFYAPISDSGWPATVYTQEMFRNKRRHRRVVKKWRSHKDYKGSRR